MHEYIASARFCDDVAASCASTTLCQVVHRVAAVDALTKQASASNPHVLKPLGMALAREAGTVLNEAMAAALTKRGRVSDSSMSQFAIYYHSNVVSRLRAVLGVSSLESRHVGHMAMIVKSAVYAAVVRMERDAQEQSHIPLPVVFNPQDHFCYCQRVCGWAMFSLMQCLWADMARALAAEEARGAQNPTRRHVRPGDLRARRRILALQRLSQDQKKLSCILLMLPGMRATPHFPSLLYYRYSCGKMWPL